MKKGLLFCFAAVAVFLSPGPACAEKIVMKSGNTLEQKIVQVDADKLIVDFYGSNLTYFWADVESVDGKSRDEVCREWGVAVTEAPQPNPPQTNLPQTDPGAAPSQTPIIEVLPPVKQSSEQIRPSTGRIKFGRSAAKYTQDISAAIRANRWGELMDLYLLRSIAYEREGQTSSIANDYRQAGAVDSKYARLFYMRMADGGVRPGAAGQALSDAEKQIAVQGPSAALLARRGFAYLLKGDFDLSIADYRKALAKEPGNAPVRQEYVFILLLLGDFQGCVKEATAALANSPNQAIMYVHRGNARFALGNTDAALADFLQGARLDPSEPECYIARAYLSEFIHMDSDPAPVIRDIDEALAHAPANAFLMLKKAAGYLRKGEFDGALQICDEAIRLDSENSRAYLMRGNIYVEKRDPAKALEAYGKALELCDTDGEIYACRARLYYGANEYKKSLSDMEKAAEFGNDLPPGFLTNVKKALAQE